MISKNVSLRQLYWVLIALIFLFFCFTRIFHLDQTLLFYGDLGRDFLVLQDWSKSLKPPLLGPQTSALPINQSAWYFYLLMPFYVLSNGSYYTHSLALIFLTLCLLSSYVYIVWPYPRLRWSLVLSFLLLTVHPETVIQQRYIWNPSFIPILILGGSLLFSRSYYHRLGRGHIFMFTLLLACAVGVSYASIPVVLLLLLFSHLRGQVARRFLWASFVLNLGMIMLPTLLFELRHQFLLTDRLLFGEKLSFPDPLLSKIVRLPNLLFSDPPWLLLAGCVLILIFTLIRSSVKKDKLFKDVGLIVLFSLTITLLLPFPLNSHYIFAFVTMVFFWLSLLPIRSAFLLSLILVLYWSRPVQLGQYHVPAPRTIEETTNCVSQFCRTYPGSYYVTTQSAYHPQHDAKEYEYLFNRYGCVATDMTLPKFSAHQMAVIVEDSTYEHGKTAYNELTLFGPSQEVSVFTCQPNLSVHILEKTPI